MTAAFPIPATEFGKKKLITEHTQQNQSFEYAGTNNDLNNSQVCTVSKYLLCTILPQICFAATTLPLMQQFLICSYWQ
ncbi:hypothetical protein EUGRSUZ_H00414 [Eucalyptus grandis]|uniref:Uncharacterized protein n=2 Tax=Eucalyptus grandis TaxID=71139 RepID=A0ACC3JJV1_EUCGR|nr:hypothetical protein EUGRSUZ_H00414 [Eucalyptus grandis]